MNHTTYSANGQTTAIVVIYVCTCTMDLIQFLWSVLKKLMANLISVASALLTKACSWAKISS